jgi:CheY-like chemotaxis protein
MAKLLKLSGHVVRVAHSGPDAIASAREHAPEYVILDIGLPGMDGYEVAARLRREEGGMKSVIIAVTGYGEEQARGRSEAAGFNHHLVKPVNFDTLLSIMARPRADS